MIMVWNSVAAKPGLPNLEPAIIAAIWMTTTMLNVCSGVYLVEDGSKYNENATAKNTKLMRRRAMCCLKFNGQDRLDSNLCSSFSIGI